MRAFGRAGITVQPGVHASFAPQTERLIGNQLPAWTGSTGDNRDVPGPHPRTQPMGGNVGKYDGSSGADPWAAKRQPYPRRVAPVIEGQASNGAGPALGAGTPASGIHPLGYGQGASRMSGIDGWGWAGRLNAPNREDPLPHGRKSFWRGGIQGFRDALQVRDRHAYWDRGHQRTGLTGKPWGMPNTYNPDQRRDRARPDLRTVNISINPQIGSDKTSFQDDLSRPYTWLGQQDGTVAPIWGGVPGLYIPYGSRGGYPLAVVDPSNGEGGPASVWPGPPHGLHSDTHPGSKLLIDRYKSTPQMRPVRIDRPDNSTAAGQSYSQTVQPQRDTGGHGTTAGHRGQGTGFHVSGRGWAGG